MSALWDELANRAGLTLWPQQHALLARYLDLLDAGGQRMNLTRITDRPAAELLHVADALTLLPFLPAVRQPKSPSGQRRASDTPGACEPPPTNSAVQIRLADVGSGGGVPGIILAIARPELRVTLIESTQKKCRFLEETIASLQLANAAVIAGRAEDLAQPGGPARERFDVVVARAVATLVWLAEWCLPLAKVGGAVLAMKAGKAAEELPLAKAAIRQLGGGEAQIEPAQLPGAEGHVIVRIPKARPTPPRLPRRSTATAGRAIGTE